MTVRIYHYPSCDSCRKARRWLDDRGVSYRAIHLVDDTPSKATLKKLWKRSGLPLGKMFNTSGRAYREGKLGERLKTMSDDEALSALAADGMLVKRPILDAGDTVLVGFRPAAYEAAF